MRHASGQWELQFYYKKLNFDKRKILKCTDQPFTQ